MSEAVVVAQSVSKSYGDRPVLKDCSLSLSQDEVTLLVGRNGSGKSTLLKILTGLLAPSTGRVTREVQAIGYCGHVSMLYEHLTVFENLTLFAALSGSANLTKTRILQELEEWGIEHLSEQYPPCISQGQKTRVSLCRAFMIEAGFLALDEPDSSLDEHGVKVLLDKVKNTSAAVIITSHRDEIYRDTASRTLHLEDQRLH